MIRRLALLVALALAGAGSATFVLRVGETIAAPAGSVFATTTVVADGVSTGTVQLSSVSVTGLASHSTRAWVKSLGDWFVLGPAIGSAQTNVVVTATDGRQWVRQNIPNPIFLAAKFWAISETNGSDENAGWGATQTAADAVPLKTMAELDRRLSGCVGVVSGWTCHQLSNITSGVPLKNVKSDVVGNTPIWLGTRTTLLTSSNTTYTAENPAANTGATLAITDIPASWTASGYIGKMLVSGDGLRFAWTQKDNGSKTARITTPNNCDSSTGNPGTETTFTSGESISIVDLTSLPCFPFGDDNVGSLVADVAMTAPSVNVTSVSFGATTRVFRSSLAKFRASSRPGVLVSFSAAQFKTGTTLFGASYSIVSSGILSSNMTIGGGGSFSISHGNLDVQAGSISVTDRGGFTAFGTNSSLSAFDCTSTVLTVSDESQSGKSVRFNTAATIYGSGNSGAILSIPSGVTATLPPAANCTITTGSLNTLSVAGVAKNFSDMPYVDTSKMAAVINN